MKTTVRWWAILALALCMTSGAVPVMAGAGTNGVVIVTMDAIPGSLSKYLAGALPANLFCRIRSRDMSADSQRGDVAGVAEQVKELLREKDVACVGIVARPGELVFREYIDLTGRVAIINIAPLLPPVDRAAESDLFRWRVEKQVTRLVALLAGLPPCPFPLCALIESRTLQDVDVKGRNLCPPCQIRLEKRMQEAGLYVAPVGDPVIQFPEDK